MKIKTKINIGFLISFILAAIIMGLVLGFYTTSLLKKNIYTYLNSSSRARAEHIRTFIQDQEKESVILAAASVYRDFLKNPTDKIIKDKIYKRFVRTIEADSQIYEVFIINANGKIIASSDKTHEGLDKSNDDYFLNAQNSVFFKDIYVSPVINKINYTISAPIKDDNGVFLGISVLRYLPNNFFSIVKNENGLGNSEENFLINKDKLFITPSRFLGESVILKQKVETENSNNCFNKDKIDYINKNGYSGLLQKFGSNITEAIDYRGVDVIATNAYIPEVGWCLITKADRADLLAFKVMLTVVLLIVFIIASFIFLLVGYLISKRIIDPIKNLQIGAQKIRSGDFNYKIEINTKDELGELSEDFNSMTLAVKESKENIEKKVEEKTKEINLKSTEIENQRTAIMNVLEDVEKEKNRVEGLVNDLEKFKLAVDNTLDQVTITDNEGIVIYCNNAVKKITGYEPFEAMGKKAGVLWKTPMPNEYYQQLWDTIKNKKEVFVSEIQNKRKNGEFYIAKVNISPVLDTKGNIIYFVAIEHDITKEKEIDKAKSEFVSLASHQLRTPLSSINWYTEMLLDGDAGPINEEQKKYLNEVAIGNQRMVDLVDSLLNVSRLDLGTFIIEPKNLNIIDLVKSVLNELKPQILNKKQKVEENYDENIKEFSADEKLLRIIFQNLLSNAVKYTKKEGSVKIELIALLPDSTFEGNTIKEASIGIKVADNGMGIPENQKEKVFSKLFRADNARESETEGTGLGLYILKSIVDQSGGIIGFNTKENEGTTFYVIFPKTGMKKKEGTKKLD